MITQNISTTTAMKTSLLRHRFTAWFRAHRPLRWVETIVADYSSWNPW